MIDRQNGGIILVECDSCNEALASMKREGWKARKIADEWLHGCPRHGVPR